MDSDMKWGSIRISKRNIVPNSYEYELNATSLDTKTTLTLYAIDHSLTSALFSALNQALIKNIRLSDFTFIGEDEAVWQSADGLTPHREVELRAMIENAVRKFKITDQDKLIESLMTRYRKSGEEGLIEHLLYWAIQSKDFPRS